MLKTVMIALFAYAGTNIDDIFITTLLFASACSTKQRWQVVAGRYLGIAALTGISMLGAGGAGMVLQEYSWLLGIVPLAMGIKAALRRLKNSGTEEEATINEGNMVLTSAGMTIASGGDNIGVYLPLLTGMNSRETMVLLAVFTAMTGLWCLLGYCITGIPPLEKLLERHKDAIVPVVYILLGLYILII